MQGVPDAYIPIIKLKISGIPINFLMAHLMVLSIPDNLTLQDDNLLHNLDDRCIRSLGGSLVTPVRVISCIRFPCYRPDTARLRLVPNVTVFRDALQCIKL
jgi:poly(A) polymerase